ncbi:MAG: AMP-binding protein [Proteobacteria bacterium]|nr:AMP-binding protein [Cystobacterineae bacterium]MCL2258494.1 AMP-binding protein [Cystobacterineae bacterium]MCL2315166.1 AMP-binding protein [Pseudomonadota bacterium]
MEAADVSSPKPHPAQLHIGQVFASKNLLLTGVTGFLGKVTLSMLLDKYGEQLNKIYVLVRKGSLNNAHRRFMERVVPSEPFSPLREKYGEEGALQFFEKKCEVIEGDITDTWLGMAEAQVEALKEKIAALVNCAGLVSFNPSLQVGLDANVKGVQHAVAFCQHLKIPLIHVSTAFVAGERSGLVFEDEPVVGYFPKKEELKEAEFSLEQELKDCAKTIARIREMAEDKALSTQFQERAQKRLEREGKDFHDERTLRMATHRERRLWVSLQLTEIGMERAKFWGWPNTYTYTKSLGEQVIAQAPDLAFAILRPSIVESALRFPFPGWNEGFTTSAPLCFVLLKGHRSVPAGKQTILDMIPVDLVASAVVAATAQAIATPGRRIFHLASGDSSPCFASRAVELVGLYRRKHFRERKSGNEWMNRLKARIEPRTVGLPFFNMSSAPFFMQASEKTKAWLDKAKPHWGMPKVLSWIERLQSGLEGIGDQAEAVQNIVDIFLPFTWQHRYLFRCDNTRNLFATLSLQDRNKVFWSPEKLDWRKYFLETHLPGLEKWVFPNLEEERKKRRAMAPYRDLLELLDASAFAFHHRVAFRYLGKEGEQTRFTFGEVRHYAGRVASRLVAEGIQPQTQVLLLSENRPEWAISYFGILLAGATAVPLDADFSLKEILNIAERSKAQACLFSEEVFERLPNLLTKLAKMNVRCISLAEGMEGAEVVLPRPKLSGGEVASLLFTSGTTGVPKGVMLTHENFTWLAAKLASVFELHAGDGLLSVLPLHHSFEFSAGLLVPFICGAEVNYLDELTSDKITEALDSKRVTAMIGVPAVWQLFDRKIAQELAQKPAVVEEVMDVLLEFNRQLRDYRGVNLGKLLFWPIHQKLGGRMRYLVSGGSSLPREVQEKFHGFGFSLSEGYGLTESSPVLTIFKAENKLVAGSVGRVLPGISLKISNPDNDGVGEVWAKGPNIMAGYFEDREATDAVLKEGWLHTGDLGYLDTDGRLFLVGRKKDVIIDANGKNVYPDELEILYEKHPLIKELSILGFPSEEGGEKVACLCVPETGEKKRAEAIRELEEHFRKISNSLPLYRRVKALYFWEGVLPRTSTRKVKRKEVLEILKRLEAKNQSLLRGRRGKEILDEHTESLVQLISQASQKPVSEIQLSSKLVDDLGMDSLMLSELTVALEQTGWVSQGLDLTKIQTVDDLGRTLHSGRKKEAAPIKPATPKRQEETGINDIQIPDVVSSAGRKFLALGQQAIYERMFNIHVEGKPFIPQNRNFLVVANHSSHLDMGLVKLALGEHGGRLVTLAARDYFFNRSVKRFYFENFTNLIPMERQGALRESLRYATESLTQGYNLLIFPEGTRSKTGEILEFKPTVGYLSLATNVDVLPIYIRGSFNALPKGSLLPKSKDLEVRIGPALRAQTMSAHVADMVRSEAYRWIARAAEEAVRQLARGKVLDLENLDEKQTENLG